MVGKGVTEIGALTPRSEAASSRALVELAEGREPTDLVAARVARERWGSLVATPSRGWS
jgi:hypothetical protein